MAYASGKHAYGISDRSGRRYRLREMKTEWTGAKVGPDEFETKHPQLFPPRAFPDPQALRGPRPESELPEQRAIQCIQTDDCWRGGSTSAHSKSGKTHENSTVGIHVGKLDVRTHVSTHRRRWLVGPFKSSPVPVVSPYGSPVIDENCIPHDKRVEHEKTASSPRCIEKRILIGDG